MGDTVIIIPTRLKAKRFPGKPLQLINGKEMILHVLDVAKKSCIGDVLVVTPDKDILKLVDKNGGNSFLSTKNHETGTDRVFEAYDKFYSRKPKNIINLQGDMPNLEPNSIVQLANHIEKGVCDICTLASSINSDQEIKDENVVKVLLEKKIEKVGFSEVLDFKRVLSNSNYKFIYHHIGIYAFTNEALIKYVKLKRSKLELERKLEQLRALENNMTIQVGYTNSNPLSVDTKGDLLKLKKIMENK